MDESNLQHAAVTSSLLVSSLEIKQALGPWELLSSPGKTHLLRPFLNFALAAHVRNWQHSFPRESCPLGLS